MQKMKFVNRITHGAATQQGQRHIGKTVKRRKVVDRAMHRADRSKVDYSPVTFAYKLELTCLRRKIGAWIVGVWQIIQKQESVYRGLILLAGLSPSYGALILLAGL